MTQLIGVNLDVPIVKSFFFPLPSTFMSNFNRKPPSRGASTSYDSLIARRQKAQQQRKAGTSDAASVSTEAFSVISALDKGGVEESLGAGGGCSR